MNPSLTAELSQVSARKAARGARLYRSAFGRGVEVIDLMVIMLAVAVILKFLTMVCRHLSHDNAHTR